MHVCNLYMYVHISMSYYKHICINTYIHTYMHPYIHGYIHTYVHLICACMDMHTYRYTMNVCLHTCIPICIHTPVCIHACNIDVYTCTCLPTYRLTYVCPYTYLNVYSDVASIHTHTYMHVSIHLYICCTGVVYDNLSVMFMQWAFSINNKVG